MIPPVQSCAPLARPPIKTWRHHAAQPEDASRLGRASGTTPILSQLLKAEMAEREVRSIAYHMKAARFPAYKDLSGFDFTASEIREALVRHLHRCEFMDGTRNVVLIPLPPSRDHPLDDPAGQRGSMLRSNARKGAVPARGKAMLPSCWKHASGVTPGIQAIEHHRTGTGKSQRQGREDR